MNKTSFAGLLRTYAVLPRRQTQAPAYLCRELHGISRTGAAMDERAAMAGRDLANYGLINCDVKESAR